MHEGQVSRQAHYEKTCQNTDFHHTKMHANTCYVYIDSQVNIYPNQIKMWNLRAISIQICSPTLWFIVVVRSNFWPYQFLCIPFKQILLVTIHSQLFLGYFVCIGSLPKLKFMFVPKTQNQNTPIWAEFVSHKFGWLTGKYLPHKVFFYQIV